MTSVPPCLRGEKLRNWFSGAWPVIAFFAVLAWVYIQIILELAR